MKTIKLRNLMKYKHSRKKMAQIIEDVLGDVGGFRLIQMLLATKPDPPKETKEKCDHDHLCCPGDIRTARCAYCGKSMYHEPQEELEVEELDLQTEYDWCPVDREILIDNLNSLIKAHNALVKEVKRL